MIFDLSTDEIALLKSRNISFTPAEDYDDGAALEFLDKVREAQVSYAQDEDALGQELYSKLERLADKIHEAIPD